MARTSYTTSLRLTPSSVVRLRCFTLEPRGGHRLSIISAWSHTAIPMRQRCKWETRVLRKTGAAGHTAWRSKRVRKVLGHYCLFGAC